MCLKKICSFTVFILLLIVNTAPVTPIVRAQPDDWSEDIRLTNDLEISQFPSIAVEGNNIHVVFYELTEYSPEADSSLCYIRSLDNGNNWEPLRRLENIPGRPFHPKIAASGQNLHVIWRDRDDKKIHYIRSVDNGNSWSNDKVISQETYYPYENHNIVVYDNNIHVAFVNANNKITYVGSQDNGNTWSNPKVLVESNSTALDTEIAVYQKNIHVVWVDLYNRQGKYNVQIYYIRSVDNGVTWSEDVNISTSTGNTSQVSWPNIAISENDIYTVYCGKGTGTNREVFYSYSKDNGLNWTKDIQLSHSVPHTYIFMPSITIVEDSIYVVWAYQRIYFKSSSDRGITWSPDTHLSNGTSWQGHPGIAANRNGVHVVWEDERDRNPEIYYKKMSREPQKVQLSIDIDPDSLNLKSKGRWITAYIETPSDYDVSEINISSLLLEGSIPAEKHPVEIGDHNSNNISDLMVKFDRADVEDIVSPSSQVELIITGNTNSNIPLEGSDLIRVF